MAEWRICTEWEVSALHFGAGFPHVFKCDDPGLPKELRSMKATQWCRDNLGFEGNRWLGGFEHVAIRTREDAALFRLFFVGSEVPE